MTTEEPFALSAEPPPAILKPCPFCGKPPTRGSFIMAYIRCESCRIEMIAYQDSMDFLVEKWNTRTP